MISEFQQNIQFHPIQRYYKNNNNKNKKNKKIKFIHKTEKSIKKERTVAEKQNSETILLVQTRQIEPETEANGTKP